MIKDIRRRHRLVPSLSTGASLLFTSAVAAACLFTCAPPGWASDAPRQAYDIDVGCAAAAAAAKTAVSGPADEGHRVEADQLARLTLVSAEAAGQRLGLQAAVVHQAVDDDRESLLRYAQQPDPAKAASERAELGRTLIRCALLHAIEKTSQASDGEPTVESHPHR